MDPIILAICIVAAIFALVGAICGILALRKRPQIDERALADRVAEGVQRQTLQNNEAVLQALSVQTQNLENRLQVAENAAERFRQESLQAQTEMAKEARALAREERQEMQSALETQRQAAEAGAKQTLDLTGQRLDALRQEMGAQMKELRQDNQKQLDEMRGVVDKQLHENLENRLTKSFGLITDKLEQVYKGLGEMQNLSSGVADLKRVLSGVKTRGIWGELSLHTLLEDILTPDQYVCDFHPKGDRGAVVEFAVKLPGQGEENVYLPIDSKFPLEDYERLVDAADQGDKEAITRSVAALETRIKTQAKEISKYINPPYTTDFAVLYLPIEGLFAEVTRQVGLTEQLRRQYKVVVAGPTTLTALLNSLQVGFRTLAIEKRSKELWALLESFRTAFDRFSVDLNRAEKQLDTVMGTLHDTGKRTQNISKQLQKVTTLAPIDATELEVQAAAVALEGEENE